MTSDQTNSISIIPEEYFLKPEGAQFKKSFTRQLDAVKYARQNGYRLVIACEAEGRYYVLHDPGQAANMDSELSEHRNELVGALR